MRQTIGTRINPRIYRLIEDIQYSTNPNELVHQLEQIDVYVRNYQRINVLSFEDIDTLGLYISKILQWYPSSKIVYHCLRIAKSILMGPCYQTAKHNFISFFESHLPTVYAANDNTLRRSILQILQIHLSVVSNPSTCLRLLMLCSLGLDRHTGFQHSLENLLDRFSDTRLPPDDLYTLLVTLSENGITDSPDRMYIYQHLYEFISKFFPREKLSSILSHLPSHLETFVSTQLLPKTKCTPVYYQSDESASFSHASPSIEDWYHSPSETDADLPTPRSASRPQRQRLFYPEMRCDDPDLFFRTLLPARIISQFEKIVDPMARLNTCSTLRNHLQYTLSEECIDLLGLQTTLDSIMQPILYTFSPLLRDRNACFVTTALEGLFVSDAVSLDNISNTILS